MDNIKVCLYGICKNESKFIDKWYQWAKEADYICILDTGSTDDSVEKLSKLDKVILHQEIINPWRFDVARNKSKKYIPADADICAVADFDQIWRDGWSNILREEFSKGNEDITGEMIDYDNEGNEVKRFLSRNTHGNNSDWCWERPIHEGLIYKGDRIITQVYREDFVIEHHPDRTKSRGNYLDLLKEEYEYNSKDPMCMIYYGCELGFNNKYEEELQVFLKGLEECDFSNYRNILYQTYINISLDYVHFGDYEKALEYALKPEDMEFKTRRLYHNIAYIYNLLNNHEKCIEYCYKALSIKENCKYWIEDQNLFNDYIFYDLISLNYYYLNNLDNAYKYALAAWYFNQSDDRLKSNLEIVKESISNYTVGFYGICKNEMKNIDEWYKSVQQADHIFILDTGSTDGSVKHLQELGINVESKEYEEFSFGKARQDALERLIDLYPDIDVCITVDFDEFLNYDWYIKLQKDWNPEYNIMKIYGLTTNNDGLYISENKVHTSNLNRIHWERSIHEKIVCNESCISGYSNITYFHLQDKSKERKYYEYTKRAYESDNKTILDCVYYGWECRNIKDFENYFKANLTAYEMYCDEKNKYYMDESINDMELKAQVMINISSYYYTKGFVNLAETYLALAERINVGFEYRRIHCLRSFMLEKQNLYKEAINELKLALAVNIRPSCWIEDNMYYNDAYVESHLAFLYRLLADKDNEIEIMKSATEKYPDSYVVNKYNTVGIIHINSCELGD